MRIRGAAFGLWFLGSTMVLAQSVPSYVNYQGRLTDAAGAPLATRDYDLTFRIYDAATGGALVWGPLHFDVASGGSLTLGHKFKVPVVQGYFNVMLGDVDESNRSVLTAFNAVPRYVEVTVEDGCPTPPCSPILPRQQILTAPYAAQAASVRGASNVFPSTGNVGVGRTDPTYQLDVAGSTRLGGPVTALGGLSVAAGAMFTGDVTVGGAMATFNELSATKMHVGAQKALYVTALGAWASWGVVPAGWPKETARSLAESIGATHYALMCVTDQTFSIPTGGDRFYPVSMSSPPLPPNNVCGW